MFLQSYIQATVYLSYCPAMSVDPMFGIFNSKITICRAVVYCNSQVGP